VYFLVSQRRTEIEMFYRKGREKGELNEDGLGFGDILALFLVSPK